MMAPIHPLIDTRFRLAARRRVRYGKGKSDGTRYVLASHLQAGYSIRNQRNGRVPNSTTPMTCRRSPRSLTKG